MTHQALTVYYVLTRQSHGSAAREDQLYGGPAHHRYLDVYGRWVAQGTPMIPLLAWDSPDAAQAACATASSVRKGAIEVSTVAGGNFVPGNLLRLFAPTDAPALAGQLPRERITNTKLAADCHKMMVFTRAVLALHEAQDDTAKLHATALWNRIISQAFGGGSVVSASQFMAGRRAAHVISRYLCGSLVEDDELPLSDIARAVEIARTAPWNQST